MVNGDKETTERKTKRNEPEQLVDEHSGEERDEDADDGQAEQGAQTGVQSPVHHLAVRRVGENVPAHT